MRRKILSFEKKFVVFAIIIFTFSQRGFHETASNWMRLLFGIILALIYIITIRLLFKYKIKFLYIIRQNKSLLFFTLIILFSIAWSNAPVYTAETGILLVLTTLFSVYIVSSFSLHDFLRILALGLFLLVFINFIAVFVFPEHAIHRDLHYGQWRGIYFHRDGLSREMGIAVLLFLFIAKEQIIKRKLAFIGFFLSSVLLLMARGMGPLFALISALFIFLLSRSILRSHSYLRTCILIFSIFIVALTGSIISSNYVAILSFFNKDVSLTNRVPIWIFSIGEIKKSLWLGYGFNAFWLDKSYQFFMMDRAVTHAHNLYLDLMLDLGLIGALLFFIILSKSIRMILRELLKCRNPDSLWFLTIIGFIFVYGMANSIFNTNNNLLWILFVTSSLYLSLISGHISQLNQSIH